VARPPALHYPTPLKTDIEIVNEKVWHISLKTIRYMYWQDEDIWLGYIKDYPNYITQGESLKKLQENLKDIYDDLTGGHIPNVRKIAELPIA